MESVWSAEKKIKNMNAKTQYAIMKVQESELWQVCHDLNWPEGLRAQYKELTEKLEKFGNENFENKYTISGQTLIHDDGTYKGHYDIEDDIKEDGWVERGVSLDSESGCFFAYAPESLKDEFFEYVKENFEWEGIGMDWNNFNGYIAPFWRVEEAQVFLDENGVEVPDIVSKQARKAVDQMRNLKERKDAAELKYDEQIELLKGNL